MNTEQLNQERVAQGPAGLGEELNKIYSEKHQEPSSSLDSPYRFIPYKNGDLNAVIMVDVKATPVQIWYNDYQDGRAADYSVRNTIKQFLWEKYGDPKASEAEQLAQRESLFNSNYIDLAKGVQGDLLQKKAEESYLTNGAIEGRPRVTQQLARSQMILLASTRSNVSTSKASFFSLPPVRRPEAEPAKEQTKTIEPGKR